MEQENKQSKLSKIPQPVSPREWAQLPPTEFISSFTLQQKQAVGTSFAGNTDRFDRHKVGSFFATGTAEPSSFRLNNPFHKPRILSKEEVPVHRPLWLSELRKEVPAGAQYDIDSTFGSKKTLFKTRGATFKSNYGKYGRTCDIQKDIQVFERNADQDQRGVASYDLDVGLNATKKRNPCFSQSKAKQFELWSKEIKRGEVTPAPNSYIQDSSKQSKLARFDNVHMGTDVKTTAKDIKLTPGPGHYVRTDEQYPRTFHHATKHGTQKMPVFSTIIQKQTARAAQNKSNDEDDFAKAKRNSILQRQSTTGSHFFGAATGSDHFYETIMQGFGQKNVQPPMLVGKAKIPSDLQCVLSFNTHGSRQQHKTIEHNRTSSSIVNGSLQEFAAAGKMSPIELDSSKKGRNSLFTKPKNRESGINTINQLSPPQRTLIASNALSEENFAEKKRKSQNIRMHVSHAKAQSKDYINVQSNEKMINSSRDQFAPGQMIQALNQQMCKPKHIKTKMTTYTHGTMSDVSTTVRAPSLHNRARKPSQSHNFAELGAGLISDTPTSKRSVDIRMRRGEKGSQISKSNLNLNEYTKRRSSMGRSASRGQMRGHRGSTRPIKNYGGLNHCNFI